jgi:hypothetical protein
MNKTSRTKAIATVCGLALLLAAGASAQVPRT